MSRPNVENERRGQILEAAMNCFARKGYDLCSMDDIAAELPFSKALIYYYFKTKRDIFLAILDDWQKRSAVEWDAMLSPADSAETQLRKSMEYSVQLIGQLESLARVEFEFFAEAGRDEAVRQSLQVLFSKFREEFKVTLDTGVANGEFRPVDSAALSAVLLGTYEGLAMQALIDNDTLDWHAILKSVIDMVLDGISARVKGDAK